MCVCQLSAVGLPCVWLRHFSLSVPVSLYRTIAEQCTAQFLSKHWQVVTRSMQCDAGNYVHFKTAQLSGDGLIEDTTGSTYVCWESCTMITPAVFLFCVQ